MGITPVRDDVTARSTMSEETLVGRTQAVTGPKASVLRVQLPSVWLVGVIALIVCVYSLRFVTSVQPGVTQDDAEYLVLAESFASGGPYRLVNYPDAPVEGTWPPGYPLFALTIPWLLSGGDLTVLRLTNLPLLIVSFLLAYALLKRYFGPRHALLVSSLFALHPRVMGTASITMSETFFVFLLLAFFFAFDHSTNGARHSAVWFIISLLALQAAVLTRYIGLSFVVALFVRLYYQKVYGRAFVLAALTAIVAGGFFTFLASQEAQVTSSYTVTRVSRGVDYYLTSAPLLLQNYVRAIPLEILPLLGPRASDYLHEAKLGWLVGVVHSLILILVGLGFVKTARKHNLIALAVAVYFLLLLFLTDYYLDSVSRPIVFNEPRYTLPVLLFLYSFFAVGVSIVLSKIFGPKRGQRLKLLVFAALAAVLLLRNVQQAQAEFPVADLAAGADWIRENTAEDVIVMTEDPVSRYLYLQRRTIAFPNSAASFWDEIRSGKADYLLVAPPLRLGPAANVEQELSPWVHSQLLQEIRNGPHCFQTTFTDSQTNVSVVKVNSVCKSS